LSGKNTLAMKKIIATSLFFSVLLVHAQIGTRIPSAKIGGEESNWTFGGYAGLGLASGSGGGTSIYITPRIGYKITDNFEMGVSGNFTWSNSKYISSTMVGVGPFANVYFGRSFYLTGMFQEYFINQKDKYYNEKYNTDEAVLYLGGGYMQRISDRVYMQVGAMYNVLYKEDKSVFSGGLIPNIGIVYGL